MRTLTRIGHRVLSRMRARWITWQIRCLHVELDRLQAGGGAPHDDASQMRRRCAEALTVRRAQLAWRLRNLRR